MDKDDIIKDFGTRVRALRQKKGWALPDLAFEAGVDAKTIHRIETAKQETKLTTIVGIALALGCKIDDLIKLK